MTGEKDNDEAVQPGPPGIVRVDRPVRPRAWLREPKVQRHPGRHLVRGVTTVELPQEEREFAELDGDNLVPLYEERALRDDEREVCAQQLERLGYHELATCLRNYRENLGSSSRPNV